jgi:cytoskeletal protein CcmA (bactofilin family)
VKPQQERFSIPAVAPVPSAVTQDKPKVPDKQSVMPDPQTKNILSKDVEIKGNIKFTNELVIDGKIEGEIASDGVLTVGENADIRGEIKTKSVTVLGKVNGNITVTERCELKARAHLVGDLKASRLVIEEGATFVGKSEVTMNKAALPINKTPIESSSKEESKTPAFSGAR